MAVSRDEMLPIEPFRDWLKTVVARCGGVEKAEGSLGMRPRAIRRFVSPSAEEARATHVSLDLVDQAVTHEGRTFLWELYGELYDFDGPSIPRLFDVDDLDRWIDPFATCAWAGVTTPDRSPQINQTVPFR